MLVAGALSRRVQRVVGRRDCRLLLGDLLQDERVDRMQVVLKLLLGAGADLANGGALRRLAMGRSSAADVMLQVMCKMLVAPLSLDLISSPPILL